MVTSLKVTHYFPTLCVWNNNLSRFINTNNSNYLLINLLITVRISLRLITVSLVKVTSAIPNQPNSIELNTESKRKVKKQTSDSSDVIGFCSLDLMPILLGNVQNVTLNWLSEVEISFIIPFSGERSFTERLIVETTNLSFDTNAISWQNLPVLIVTITYDDKEIFPVNTKINFLSITMESIYNPPSFFAEDKEYKAGTIMYIDNEVYCISLNNNES